MNKTDNIKKNVLIILLFVLFFVGCYAIAPGKSNILFEDDFSDSSALARNWEIHDAKNPSSGPSIWFIRGGELWQTSNIFRSGSDEYDFYEGTNIVTKQGNNWSNYEFTSEFRITGDNDGVGFIFRYQDEEHYYRFIVLQDPGNLGPFRRIQVKNGDMFVTLAESKVGYDPAEPHKFSIKVIDKDITVSFDGQEILSAKDDHYASGRIGFLAYAEQPVFDNVRVSIISK